MEQPESIVFYKENRVGTEIRTKLEQSWSKVGTNWSKVRTKLEQNWSKVRTKLEQPQSIVFYKENCVGIEISTS